MIRTAIITDSAALAKLHILTLSGSFLASLGLGFLNSLYKFLINKEKVWVYEESNEIRGFVSFSQDSSGMMKRFLINCPFCLLLLMVKTIFQPILLKRFFETFQAPFKSQKGNGAIGLPAGELLSISVSSNYQATGIGSQLIQVLEEHLQQNKIISYKVVAGEDLIGANKFYLKNNFILASRIKIHGDKLSNVYIKAISISHLRGEGRGERSEK